MAINSRNNVQIIHHTPHHRTCRRPSAAVTRRPSSSSSSSSSSSLTTTPTTATNTSSHQISLTPTRKMPAILPSGGDDHNSSIRSSSSRTLHSTSPPTENSFPCSYARTPKPPTRGLFKTPFTVTVGPDAQPFHVHREAFAAASPFFAACLNPAYAFREAAASTVHLPAARPTDFEYLVQWVYTGALDHEELDVDHPAYFRLIKLWLLADELAVEGCKNGVVDAMARVADRSNSVPTPDDTRTVFGEEGVREGAGLRGLVVDLFAWKKTDQLVEAHEDSWDETFMRSLVCKLKRMDAREKGKAPWRNDADRCRLYHEHTTGQSTCGVMEAKRWAK